MKTSLAQRCMLVAVVVGCFGTAWGDEPYVVRVAPIVKLTPTADDDARHPGLTPPSSEAQVPVGSTFYIELWATNSGAPLDGLACVYVDLTYDRTDLVDAIPPEQDGALFPIDVVSPVFVATSGLIDDTGGCQAAPPDHTLGVDEWVLVERFEMDALAPGGPVTASLQHSDNFFAFTTLIDDPFGVDPADIDFQLRSFMIVCSGAGDCDDGLFCNGAETCDSNGLCQPGEAPCAPGEVCDEDADTCGLCSGDLECDDGLYCNGAETCSTSGLCQAGDDPCPDDGVYCNGTEYCDEDADTCGHTGDPCATQGLNCDEAAGACSCPIDNVKSCQDHGGSYCSTSGTACHEDTDCPLWPAETCEPGYMEYCLDIGEGGTRAYDNVEPRMQLGVPLELEVTATCSVDTATVSVSCAPNPYGGTATVVADGTIVARVQFSQVPPNKSCCTLTFSGDIEGCWPIVILEGDVNFDCMVSTADTSSVKARLEETAASVGCQYDVNRDGFISTADKSNVKARLEDAVVCPCTCP